MLTYQPIIEYLEKGGDAGALTYNWEKKELTHPLLQQLIADFEKKFGEDSHPYLGGADDLELATVHGPFRIHEYDGSESVIHLDEEHYFTLEELEQ